MKLSFHLDPGGDARRPAQALAARLAAGELGKDLLIAARRAAATQADRGGSRLAIPVALEADGAPPPPRRPAA